MKDTTAVFEKSVIYKLKLEELQTDPTQENILTNRH